MAADKRRSSFSSFVRSLNSCTRFPNLVALHGSSKPGKRSFGRFSRPLLEVYFQTSFRYEPKVKSLAVAEIFRYCKGFRLSYSYFCLLDQKYKRGLLNQIFSAISKGSQRRKLRELVHVSGGKTPSMSNSLYWNGDIVWISSKDMKSSRISGSELKITNLALNEMTLYHPGTLLLVARSGILKHSLPLAILEVDATINQDIKALQVHGCNAFYLYYAILSQEDMQEHNDQCRALVGKDYALITVRRYESCKRYLAELIRQKYGK